MPLARSAAIVGAGIGGLATALALAGRGHQVTLLERRTAFAESGAGIQLSPNVSRVLFGLGLGPALRRAASEPERVVVRGLRSGRTIGTIALGRFMRERFGAPYLVAHRADLHTILLDAVRARPNVRLLFGRDGTTAVDGPDGVALTVGRAGASETLRADLVIGADGLWSSLRASLGDLDPPRYRGYAAWRATVPRAAVPAALAGNETGLWLGPAGHVVHYPIAGGQALNLVVVLRRAEPVAGWSAVGAPDELRSALASAAEPLRALVEPIADWRVWSLFDRPAATLARGRIALVGDAAHPVLPFLAQGGALAIEDAAALAGALDEAPDVGEALQRYAEARLPRVRRVQRQARRNGRTYHAGFPVALVRDWVIARSGPERLAERYAWLYGWQASTDKR